MNDFHVAAAPRAATSRAAATATPALVVSGLECQRGERPLFTGLDFTAPAGAIVWVRGANGRGKTTLLRTLAGLSAPSAGTIVRRGACAGWKLLYLAHANALKEDLSVGESLAFLLRVHGEEPRAGSIDAALECLDLGSRKHAAVRTLSQGQRRRVALAPSSQPRSYSSDGPRQGRTTWTRQHRPTGPAIRRPGTPPTATT